MFQQVTLGRRALPDKGAHGASGGAAERARRRASPSRRIVSQSSLVIAVGSPLSNASSNRVSNRAFAWRCCSSRTSARTYSLVLLYPPAATWASMKCFMASGKDTFMVCIAVPPLASLCVPYHVCQFLARLAMSTTRHGTQYNIVSYYYSEPSAPEADCRMSSLEKGSASS